MAKDNPRFKLTDERLEWDHTPAEGDSPGDGESEEIDRSERRRTLMIAGEGALAGGLAVAFVATAVVLSTSTGAAAPRSVAQAPHPTPSSKAVVVGPVTKPHRALPKRGPVKHTRSKHSHQAKHTDISGAVGHRAHRHKPKKQHRFAPPRRYQHHQHHHPPPPVRRPHHHRHQSHQKSQDRK
jgi:hypothetical protein